MARGEAEDTGGLTPAKDGNGVPLYFIRRTLPILDCVDYMVEGRTSARGRSQEKGAVISSWKSTSWP